MKKCIACVNRDEKCTLCNLCNNCCDTWLKACLNKNQVKDLCLCVYKDINRKKIINDYLQIKSKQIKETEKNKKEAIDKKYNFKLLRLIIKYLNHQLINELSKNNYVNFEAYMLNDLSIKQPNQFELRYFLKNKDDDSYNDDCIYDFPLRDYFINKQHNDLYDEMYYFIDSKNNSFNTTDIRHILIYKYSIEVKFILDQYKNLEHKYKQELNNIENIVYMQCKECKSIIYDYECNDCKIKYCKNCLDFSCDKNCTTRTICPICLNIYEKEDGCDDLFCSKCNIAFHFKDKKQIHSNHFYHNSTYLNFLKTNDKKGVFL